MTRKSFLVLLLCFSPLAWGQWNFTPGVELGIRQYNPDAAREQQEDNVELDPSVFFEWDYADQSTGVSAGILPVVTIAADNSAIPDFDMREFYLAKEFEHFQLRVGFNTLFWGVAESRHLVDIVNQRVLVRNLDGEQKLGELIFQYDYYIENGTLSLLYLPYFRPQDYSEPDERLSLPLEVIRENYVGQSKQDRESFVLRYSGVLDNWDIGSYFFHGLDRNPAFELTDEQGFTANYSQLDQVALDVQYTASRWLGKGEGVYREHALGGTSWAYVIGGEYYFYGIFAGAKDLSLLVELHRDTDATARSNQIYRNASFVGTRLAWNDIDDTSFLAGALIDNHGDSWAIKAEYETRLSNQLSLDIEARLFLKQAENHPFYLYRDDDFIEVRLMYYL